MYAFAYPSRWFFNTANAFAIIYIMFSSVFIEPRNLFFGSFSTYFSKEEGMMGTIIYSLSKALKGKANFVMDFFLFKKFSLLF